MENITYCHLCGSQNHSLLFEQVDLFHGLPGKFTVWQCNNCGLVFLNPRPSPDELMAFYPDSFVAYTRSNRKTSRVKMLNPSYGQSKRVDFVEKFGLAGRMLDVGCASGSFLSQVEQDSTKEWQLYGVEPNEKIAEVAQQNTSANIFAGYLEDAKYPDNFFDVVTMWDVIEHVFSPVATLQEIKRILKPGGMLVFSTPNLDSWDAHLFKNCWLGYEVPRHLHIFDEKTLRLLLLQGGFSEVERACVAGSYFYFISSVVFCLRAHLPGQWPPGHWLSQWLWQNHRSILLRLLTAPYYLFTDKMRKSTTLTLACQPTP